MPCLRHRSAVLAPSSCSFSTPIICSSVNRDRFIAALDEILMIRSHRAVAAILAAGLFLLAGRVVQAQQQKQMAPQSQAAPPTAPQPRQLQQVALTDKQVQGLLDSQHEMDAIT